MMKKFVCPICGYVHEGTEAPERCPQCKQLVEWKVLDESAGLNFVTEHVIGIAKDTDDEMKKVAEAVLSPDLCPEAEERIKEHGE